MLPDKREVAILQAARAEMVATAYRLAQTCGVSGQDRYRCATALLFGAAADIAVDASRHLSGPGRVIPDVLWEGQADAARGSFLMLVRDASANRPWSGR